MTSKESSGNWSSTAFASFAAVSPVESEITWSSTGSLMAKA